MDQKMKALMRLMAQGDDSDKEILSAEETAEKLKAAYAAYLVEHKFEADQLVQKKAGGNYVNPADGYPAIVISTNETPGESQNAGDTVERYETMRIGVLHGTKFLMLMVNPLRFEPCAG